MGLGSTRSAGLRGVTGFPVRVEVDVSPGLPTFTVSGRADSACAQAPDRVRAACANSGHPVPRHRVTVNLSPASLPKVGSGFDLPIAVAVLSAAGEIPQQVAEPVVHVGELGLDGSVRPVRGVLPLVLAAAADGARHVVVPVANAKEARLVRSVQVHPVAQLGELVTRYQRLHRALPLEPVAEPPDPSAVHPPEPDLADVLGQAEARLALEIAAAGGHHLYLVGPPGAGKSMLAERLPGLLPELDDEQALEATAIASVLGTRTAFDTLERRPPFVAPHHSASMPALVGGGSGVVLPGAVTAAHSGVLFLDEAPEFKPEVIQALRQPLESGWVRVVRVSGRYRFPCRFQLVLAANPCPCGFAFGKGTACTCTPMQRRLYTSRLAGPILDRVDIQVLVPAPTRATLAMGPGEPTRLVARRVASAREAQRQRWKDFQVDVNARVPGSLLRSAPYRLPPRCTDQLGRAVDQGVLTLRGYDRCLRLAWTVADLAGRSAPVADDIGLALALRHRQAAAA